MKSIPLRINRRVHPSKLRKVVLATIIAMCGIAFIIAMADWHKHLESSILTMVASGSIYCWARSKMTKN